jgi:SNF2 family DNA or RNA helicase
MKFVPHTYQQHAIEHILMKPAAGLFLDMGLGKTVITLTAINELLFDSFEVSRVLVVAPKRVAETTWTAEAEKWDHTKHLRISRVLGSEKHRVQALNTAADIYVINRENVEWLVNYYQRKWPFDMVVIDELSSFKSSKARRFRALRKVRSFIKRIVGLTGTPAPNGLIDLWSQVYLLDKGERLGKTLTGYRTRYFLPGKRNGHIVFEWIPISEEKIHEKIADICISMKAADWLEMPERIDRVVPVQMSEAAKKRYKQLERDLLLPFADGDVVADTAAVLANKLIQMANGAVYDEAGTVKEIHSAKLDALEDVIEAANGKPVLVFYNYKHDLDRIRQRFDVRTLDSITDIYDWNAGQIPILLAHPASAGHGLNLQAGGNIIIWFGLPWSLELYEQANARLHRQGQQEKVIVHHLVTEGTMDEDVMKALEEKAIGQNALVEAVKARIPK